MNTESGWLQGNPASRPFGHRLFGAAVSPREPARTVGSPTPWPCGPHLCFCHCRPVFYIISVSWVICLMPCLQCPVCCASCIVISVLPHFLIRSPVLFRYHTSRLNSLPCLLGISPSSQNSVLLFPGWVCAWSGIPSGLSYCFCAPNGWPFSHSSPSCPALIKFSRSSLRVIFLSSPFIVVVFFSFQVMSFFSVWIFSVFRL